ncbi:MAG: hypothetical protein IJA63_01385 [Akkermansia sp.]|nr:hypothetical protein [Akkermansia sp.]
MPRYLQKSLLLGIGVLAALCPPSCQQQKVAPGIYPEPRTGFFSRRAQVRLVQEKADVAVIFIGGFSEQVLTHFRAVYEMTPPLPTGGKQVRAFYAWDGGRGCLPFHSTRLLRNDLQAFLKINPEADIIFIGHSYGGSAIMDAIRKLDCSHGKILAVTLDAVSCRERSMPRHRAPGVDYWINVYCHPYRHPKDLAAMVGGQWRECPQADVNICFSGKQRDAKGRRYQHARPDALFTETSPPTGISALELLRNACLNHNLGN